MARSKAKVGGKEDENKREGWGMVVLMYHGPAIWRGREKRVVQGKEGSRSHTHACMPYMVWPACFCQCGASDQEGPIRVCVVLVK
jgi:hypothetical protein